MQLGFVSAVLGELSLEQVLAFADDAGFGCVEVMCWPAGVEQRFAGVTHLDVSDFDDYRAGQVRDLVRTHGVQIAGLGYYPNPLDPDPAHRRVAVAHLEKVIDAARRLGVGVVNTFIGRDPSRPMEAQWPLVREVWPPLVARAERAGVRLGIENCPMLSAPEQWPGGKNLAVGPAAWRKLFELLDGPGLGLNFDPSHLVWQRIDYIRCVREFGSRIVHVHAKDTRIDHERLYEEGVLGTGWHRDKLPGLGEVDWPALFAALTEAGYRGPVCVEVEDRAYEGSLDDRLRALRQSKRFLEQWVSS
jgi:sugar phosphate isomerase/epimerase